MHVAICLLGCDLQPRRWASLVRQGRWADALSLAMHTTHDGRLLLLNKFNCLFGAGFYMEERPSWPPDLKNEDRTKRARPPTDLLAKLRITRPIDAWRHELVFVPWRFTWVPFIICSGPRTMTTPPLELQYTVHCKRDHWFWNVGCSLHAHLL